MLAPEAMPVRRGVARRSVLRARGPRRRRVCGAQPRASTLMSGSSGNGLWRLDPLVGREDRGHRAARRRRGSRRRARSQATSWRSCSAVAEAMSPMSRLAAVRWAIALRSSVSPRRACICSKRCALSIASAAERQTASTVAIVSGEKARSRAPVEELEYADDAIVGDQRHVQLALPRQAVELGDLLRAALGVVPAVQDRPSGGS